MLLASNIREREGEIKRDREREWEMGIGGEGGEYRQKREIRDTGCITQDT